MKARIIALIAIVGLTAGFYYLKATQWVMDGAVKVSSFLRGAIGALTGLLPFSVFEVGGIILLLVTLILILTMLMKLITRKMSAGRAIKRLLSILVVYGAIFALFLWLWCAEYYATPFYEGVLENRAATLEELSAATEYFARGANEYSVKVARDEGKHISAEAKEMLANAAKAVSFTELQEEFPRLSLTGATVVKPMIFSEVMSYLRYTGNYIAVTGEANINVKTPLGYLPAVAAHELSHSHGIGAEDETNFLGIIAAIGSEDEMYVYSGYLSGLTYLGNALYDAAPERYWEIVGGLTAEVVQDIQDNAEYWKRYEKTRITEKVDEVYDAYLKGNAQEQGLKSYGACVNLLAEWVAKSTD